MRKTILAAAFFLALGQIGNATPWDIETAPGQWSHNPDCTGQCAIDRSDAMQGHKPKPGKPEIVEEPGNKGPRQMLQADKRDREPPVSNYIGYWCANPAAIPACVDCADPESGKPRPPRPLTLKPCGPMVHIKGGVIGQW